MGDVSVYDGDAWALVQKQLEFFEKAQPKLFESFGLWDIPKRDDIIAFKYTNKVLELVGGQNIHKTSPLREGGLYSPFDSNRCGLWYR